MQKVLVLGILVEQYTYDGTLYYTSLHFLFFVIFYGHYYCWLSFYSFSFALSDSLSCSQWICLDFNIKFVSRFTLAAACSMSVDTIFCVRSCLCMVLLKSAVFSVQFTTMMCSQILLDRFFLRLKWLKDICLRASLYIMNSNFIALFSLSFRFFFFFFFNVRISLQKPQIRLSIYKMLH